MRWCHTIHAGKVPALPAEFPVLIRDGELQGERRVDLRVEGDRILCIAANLAPYPAEQVIDAAGGAVLPGLHDHHIHLAAYAAAMDSVNCGPPAAENAEELARLLEGYNQETPAWLRGVRYHESVAGTIDRDFLDRLVPARPVRIQHRSGRLWIFNSAAINALQPDTDAPLEREAGRFTGRLYDADAWLRERLGSRFPDLSRASHELASWGVTGITDATATNSRDTLVQFETAQRRGELLQSALIMGDDSLNGVRNAGSRKFHLHDATLPDFDRTVAAIARAHDTGRTAAFHCVTRTDLAFALAALEAAGARSGDRIEHASIAPPELVTLMRRLGVAVVTQPNFIADRGDYYLAEVDRDDLPWLYRVRSLAGVTVAGGTDAPFGSANPWALMHAAVHRKTRRGQIVGFDERISPEAALGLFLAKPDDLAGPPRRVAEGEMADLVVLDRPWREAGGNLAGVRIMATVKAGRVIFNA
jgi:predicted amidohydrolase YtcJ